jgi:phosphomannomutase
MSAVKTKKGATQTLRATLAYQPAELAFGTSGLRGRVRDITSLEAYAATRGFLAWIKERGEIIAGGTVFVAGDLRPSTSTLVAEEDYHGEILQSVCRAIGDAGFAAGNLGMIPTPALVLHAMKHGAPSIMVTGSHIPFDRNGIKFTRASGEVLKEDEKPILEAVCAARQAEYDKPAHQSMFDTRGMMRPAYRVDLPPASAEGETGYETRYTEAFPAGCLAGLRIMVWEHAAVGREILARVLESLGAEVIRAGRLDSFIAVDTEAVNASMIAMVQALVDAHDGASIDAVASTDGDSDRPLLLAVTGGKVRFIPGDLLGLVAAIYLGATDVAVPVNVNDAVDALCAEKGIALTRTRIGSPWVIAGMKDVGWEGNGGFLTARGHAVPAGGTLTPLPTRDALLPILCALCAARAQGIGLSALIDELPKRYGVSVLLRDFPMRVARDMMQWFSPSDSSVDEARFGAEGVRVITSDGGKLEMGAGDPRGEELGALRARLESIFHAVDGFSEVALVSWRDGVRVVFLNGDVAHWRPSGNAPEMRFYATADTLERARAIADLAVAETGLLRTMAREAGERMAIADYRATPHALLLHGAVQHYAWGGFDFIPGLLNIENPARQPFAELWMGAHQRAPAHVEMEGAVLSLDHLVASEPLLTLGSEVALMSAGRLPYLFKILDVRDMLSIQAHPSKAQAEEGFARENAAGIPLDAPERNYRDDNHKPEVHVALSDFWMLHGFRRLEEMVEALGSEPSMTPLAAGLAEKIRAAGNTPAARSQLVRELYSRVMTMPQGEMDALLNPLIARLEAAGGEGTLTKESTDFWALRAAHACPMAGGHRDRGIVSVYLLNIVHLRPGQGTFQPAGTLHAYLEGSNVELMANSDNVLRGGLTQKHIDVPELLATLSYIEGTPHILEGRASSETGREYETPADEFALERIEIRVGMPYSGGREHGADTVVVTEGAATLIAAGRSLTLGRGSAAIVPAHVAYSLAARGPHAVLFKAGMPRQVD